MECEFLKDTAIVTLLRSCLVSIDESLLLDPL